MTDGLGLVYKAVSSRKDRFLDKAKPSQAKVLMAINDKRGRIHVVNGPAGTGKTFLIGGIGECVDSEMAFSDTIDLPNGTSFNVPNQMVVLSPTGVAALNVIQAGFCSTSSQTFARFFYRYLKAVNAPSPNLRSIVASLPPYLFERLEVVVVDEVSMLHHRYIEFLCLCQRRWRFTLVFCGDFWQLPPMAMNHDVDEEDEESCQVPPTPSSIAEQCEVLRRYDAEWHTLVDQVRITDKRYSDMLDDFRVGKFESLVAYPFGIGDSLDLDTMRIGWQNAFSQRANAVVQERYRSDFSPPKEYRVEVSLVDDFAKFQDVVQKALNGEIKLNKLKEGSEEREIFLQIKSILSNNKVSYLPQKIADEEPVMVRKNIYNGSSLVYANGSIVTMREARESCEVVERLHKKKWGEYGSFSFYPVILAYALNAHKTQGLSISRNLYIALDNLCHSRDYYNLLYVALSRRKGSMSSVSLDRKFRNEDISSLLSSAARTLKYVGGGK